MDLTTRETAERLGISQSRVRQLILAGELKATLRTPRLLLIDEKDVAKYRRPPMGRPVKIKRTGAK